MTCLKCHGFGILPNRMWAVNNGDDPDDFPMCACGKPSRLESGDCGEGHGAVYCDCEIGRRRKT